MYTVHSLYHATTPRGLRRRLPGSTFNNAFALASPSLKAFTRRRLSKDTSVPEPGRRTWTTGWAGSGKTSHDFLGEGSGTAGTCVLVTSTRRGLEAGPGKSAKSEAGPGTRPSRCPTARRPTGWPSAAGSNEPSRNPRRASWPHQGSQSSRPPR